MKTSLLLLRKYLFIISTLICWGISLQSHAQCGGPAFPPPTSILATVPEASGYNVVYHLPIPSINQHWVIPQDVPYDVNHSVAIGTTPFTRIAYYMKLESPSLFTQWVWVSMDAYTSDINRIGLPTGDMQWQKLVTNMNVVDYTGTNLTGIAGNIESWSNGYDVTNSLPVPNASDLNFDFGDIPLAPNGYGSFQVHDYNAGKTIFAYNGFTSDLFSADDLGIGNNTYNSNPDWTFVSNAGLYDIKEIYVFVNTAANPLPTCLPASLSLNSGGNALLTPAMVTNAIVGNCGVQSITLSKENFNCTDIGTNTVTVNFVVDGVPSYCNAIVTVTDNIAPAITASGTALTLSCNPTPGAIEDALGSATISDNCGTPVLDVITSAVTIIGGNNSQTRTFYATDVSNNTTSVTRTVTWPFDNIAPVITATGTGLTLPCNPTAAAIDGALGSATVTDNCGTPSMTVTTSAVTIIGGNNSQTRTWTATDGGNLSSTVSRTVTWPYDNIAPVITATGSGLTLPCNPTAAAINAALGSATVTDNCGSPVLNVSTSAVTIVGTNNSQTRTWTTTDASNNTTTVSRTVTWPYDNIAPVITTTGSGLTLPCNPTAAAINAALGTATVTDNCGTPVLNVSTSAVTIVGANNSQTRTWTSTDASNNTTTVSRVVTWPASCNTVTQHIFPQDVSCNDFNDGATPLPYICYTTDNRKVKKTSPNFFYYYVNVKAPSILGLTGSFFVDIIQSKTCSGFNYYDVKDADVYDDRCKKYKLSYAGDQATGQLRILILGAVAGREYTVAVRYDTKSLKGSTYPGNTPPVCENTFLTKTSILGAFGSGVTVPGSQATIQTRPNCNVPGNNDDDNDDDDNHGNHRFSQTSEVIEATDQLTVITAPNPSTSQFSLVIKSNVQQEVKVRVVDIYGRELYKSGNVALNSKLHIGAQWLPGVYFAEINQGSQKKIIRLIKQ